MDVFPLYDRMTIIKSIKELNMYTIAGIVGKNNSSDEVQLSVVYQETIHLPEEINQDNIAIAFCGEIDNGNQIVKLLQQEGVSCNPTNHAQLVANLYRVCGIEKCLDIMEGAFAFAIHDRQLHKVILARDRFGQVPIYYSEDETCFRFASRLKALPSGKKHFDIDKTALNLFLTLDYIPSPYSIYEGVKKMMPGAYMVICPEGPSETHVYYNIETQLHDTAINEDEAIQQLHSLMEDAIKQQMNTTKPIGALLSGGIDSSIVCALMNEQSAEPIKTFSIGFNEHDYDESDRAELIVRHIESNHTKHILQYNDALEKLDDIICYYDEPFGDSSSIASYYAARLASKDVKVVLTGDCADELFAGYEKYLADYYASKYKKIPCLLRTIFEQLVKICPINAYTNNMLRKVKKVINASKHSGFDLYYDMLCLGFNDQQRQWVLKDNYYKDIKPLYQQRFDKLNPKATYLQKQQILDIQSVLEGCMFPKMGLACQHNGIVNHTPFIDRRIAEMAINLNDSLKLNGKEKKYILKKAFKDVLPAETLRYSKKGFNMPVDYWLRNELRKQLEDYSQPDFIEQQGIFDYDFLQTIIHEHLTGKENHKVMLWNFFVFQKWYEILYCPDN